MNVTITSEQQDPLNKKRAEFYRLYNTFRTRSFLPVRYYYSCDAKPVYRKKGCPEKIQHQETMKARSILGQSPLTTEYSGESVPGIPGESVPPIPWQSVPLISGQICC